MNEMPATPNQPRISRRAINTGIAWSLPVIAAAAAAPRIAASVPRRFRALVTPPTAGSPRAEGTFILPEDAEQIVFLVQGAGGGGASGTGQVGGTGSRVIHYPGGDGHSIQGSLIDVARGHLVQLVAGAGGGIGGTSNTSAGGAGFGSGGSTIGLEESAGTPAPTAFIHTRGGGGGGASALIIGGTTQTIAGAGGGGGGYSYALAPGITAAGETSAAGGSAEGDGGAPQHSFAGTVDSVPTSLTMNTVGAGSGKRAVDTVNGGSPDPIVFTATAPSFPNGSSPTWVWPDSAQLPAAAGAAASLNGANGGQGRGDAANYTLINGGPLTRVLAQSGGGGGGYAGGGAGSTRMAKHGASQGVAPAWVSFVAGGGGGGSSYTDGPLLQPGSVEIAFAGNGGPRGQAGGAGAVTVEFTSVDFDPAVHDLAGIVSELPA